MTGSREKAATSAPAVTTGAVIRREQPIVYLSHESDGSWVAHGPEPPSFDETWEGSLSVLWALDSTLAELADLPRGWYAERVAVGQPWRRFEHE